MKTAGSSTTIVNEFEMKNFLNCREYEKMINTGKLRAYNSFPSVYHLLNSSEWMESYEQWMKSYEKEKHVKKQSEVQVHVPRSSGSSRGCIFKESVSR